MSALRFPAGPGKRSALFARRSGTGRAERQRPAVRAKRKIFVQQQHFLTYFGESAIIIVINFLPGAARARGSAAAAPSDGQAGRSGGGMGMRISAVIVAAGNSTRMQAGGVSKLMMTVGGEPVLRRTLRAFDAAACISEIVVVARESDFADVRQAAAGIGKPLRITTGGRDRQASVANGVSLCIEADFVAIHDGARPFVTPALIERVCADAVRFGAASLAVPVKDTIKAVDDAGFVQSTPDRTALRAVQTPQVFERALYARALARAAQMGKSYTDDCQLVEAAGGTVFLTPGDYSNIKITTPEDLLVAEAFAAAQDNAPG